MFQRLWHRLFGHPWRETAIRVPANPERGQMLDITTLLLRCPCGAVKSAQVMGEIMEVARLDVTDKHTDELDQLRYMAGLPPGSPTVKRCDPKF